MCKSFHSDYCWNGKCCIISLSIIAILRTKLIYTCIFLNTKLNMDSSKAFVVKSPQKPHLCFQTPSWVHESIILSVNVCKDLMLSYSPDWQFSKDSLWFLHRLSTVKTFCIFDVQCWLLKLCGWLRGLHATVCVVKLEGWREGAAEKINLSGTR